MTEKGAAGVLVLQEEDNNRTGTVHSAEKAENNPTISTTEDESERVSKEKSKIRVC